MPKSKIEWTDYTWNPVWGCDAGCEYCYARNIAKRFASPMAEKNLEYGTEGEAIWIERRLKKFIPTFLYQNFENFKFPKKPARIFIGSMSDIAFWKIDWVEKVWDKIEKYPEHTFLILTKFPEIYETLDLLMPNNVWFGVTITKQREVKKAFELLETKSERIRFISFEPILEHIQTGGLFGSGAVDWVILGAMSGHNKQRTKTEWIGNLVAQAKKYDKPVFGWRKDGMP